MTASLLNQYRIIKVLHKDETDEKYPACVPGGVQLTYEDGPPIHLGTTGIAVFDLSRPNPLMVAKYRPIDATCTITQKRTTVYCKRYNAGGGVQIWKAGFLGLGAVPFLLFFWAIRQVTAAGRARDKYLAGQIHHDLVADVQLNSRQLHITSLNPYDSKYLRTTLDFKSMQDAQHAYAALVQAGVKAS